MKHKKTLIIIGVILLIVAILYALQYFGFLWTLGADCSIDPGTGGAANMSGTYQNGKCKPMHVYVYASGGNINSGFPKIFGQRRSAPTNINSNSSTSKKGAKKRCWGKGWTDAKNRIYQFEIWAEDCNAPYVNDAAALISNAVDRGALNEEYLLGVPLNDVVNELIYELNEGYYPEIKSDLILFRIAGNEVWGTGKPLHPKTVVPPKGQTTPPKSPTHSKPQPVPVDWSECWHKNFVDFKKSHLRIDISIWSKTSCKNKGVENQAIAASKEVSDFINKYIGQMNVKNIDGVLSDIQKHFNETHPFILTWYWQVI